ncbi:hypothetical protein OAO55_02300 [Bacteroidales bacterium]|nr:hypothetical protein [Bacteroidales bacterium]
MQVLISRYIEQGYLGAYSDNINNHNSKNQHISKGLRYYFIIDNAKTFQKFIPQNRLLKKTKKHYTYPELKSIEYETTTFFENSGYPFSSIQYIPNKLIDSTFFGVLKIDKGDYFPTDSIYQRGNCRINNKTIKRYYNVQRQPGFSVKNIETGDKRLNYLPFVSTSKPSTPLFKTNACILYTYHNIQKANVFDGLLGLVPNEKTQENDYILTGNFNLRLYNAFKLTDKFILELDLPGHARQKLDIQSEIPYFGGLPFGINQDFHLYKKDSTFLNIVYEPGIIFNFGITGKVILFSHFYNSNSITNITNNELPTSINAKGLGITFSNSTFHTTTNPQQGYSLNLKTHYSNKAIKNKNGNQSSHDTYVVNFELEKYIKIAPKLIALIAPQLNIILSEIITPNEQLRIGGIHTIRGVTEESILADKFTASTFELRYMFEERSNINIFYDAGYYSSNSNNSYIKDYPMGFGLGLNLGTKNGVLNISYAFDRQFGKFSGASNGKVHIGYISIF